jgi:hypothetical protein
MLFSRTQTLLIALLLLVPEGLRSRAKTLEPYPAVILPAGAGTLRIKKGTVSINRSYPTAKRHGEWEEVDVSQFLTPIAGHYFGRIAGRNFGLSGSPSASPEERERIAQTRSWMKARLAAQGFETGEIRLMSQKVTIALSSGKRSASKPSRKKSYDLD